MTRHEARRGIDNVRLEQLVSDLQQTGFYGSLEVKFESGRVVLLKKTETFKSADELRSTRNSHDNNA
jgi:hypothetical protein